MAGTREGGQATARRKRPRVPRAPLIIGEPAPEIEVLLAAPDPYRPDTVIDGGSAFGLTLRGASVRGLTKRFGGLAREDDMCIARHDPSETVIIALADGVSGASRSDLAAALAVRQAVAAARGQLDRASEQLDWGEIFEQAAWALLQEHRRASAQPDATLEQAAASMSTTLLVALVSSPASGTPRVRLAAVGDSPAYTLRGARFRALLEQEPHADGVIDGAVCALPRALRSLRSAECELEAGEVLVLCSDGIALPLAGGRGEVAELLARELARPSAIADFARLVDFSRSTYDDDRTLVAVWRRDGRASR